MKAHFIILYFLIISSTSQSQVPDSLKFKSLPPAEFLSAFQKSEKPLLIDVREYFEYKKSRLNNAINMPSSEDLELPADTIDKNSAMFFYCTSGFRSKRVAKYFFEKGFTNLYSLDGGINAWKKEDLPVDKKRIKKTHDKRQTTDGKE